MPAMPATEDPATQRKYTPAQRQDAAPPVRIITRMARMWVQHGSD